MRFTSRFSWRWLAILLASSAAFGQAPPERLPPVTETLPPSVPLSPTPQAEIAGFTPWRPAWYRRRPALWPEFAWGAALPRAPHRAAGISGVSSEPNTWLRAEYLQFYLADAPSAEPLVTISHPADQGHLGAPSTTVVWGGHAQSLAGFSGLRLSGGSWFNGQRVYGAEVSAFVLPTKIHNFQLGSNAIGDQVLALPYQAQFGGGQTPSSVVLAQPGLATGNVQIQTSTFLWGVEANALRMVSQSPAPLRSVSLLAGVRFVQLGEHFSLASETISASGTVDRNEAVHTQSSFFGLQIGGRATQRWGRLSFQATAKTGFGATSNLLTLSGQNNGFSFGSPMPALPADLRRNYLYDFSVLPEVQGRLSYDVRPNWRVSTGYNFMYWTRVLRASNQLDNRVDLSLPSASLMAPLSALPLDRHSNFWLHGWNIAVEWIH